MIKGMLAAAGAYVLWGLLTFYWKWIQPLDATVILAYRIALAAGFCLIVYAVTGGFGKLKAALADKKRLLICTAAGIAVTLNWGLYIYAVNDGKVLATSLGYYINPLFVLLVSAVAFGEKLNKVEWCCVALAAVGVAVAIIGFGGLPWIALAIPATFTVYATLKKYAGCDPLTALALETLSVAPFAIAYIIFMECTGRGAIATLPPSGLFTLSFAGVVTATPLIMYGYSITKLPMSTVGFFQYITPTMTLLLGIFVFGERFTAGSAVTFGFIAVALSIYACDKLIHSPAAKL